MNSIKIKTRAQLSLTEAVTARAAGSGRTRKESSEFQKAALGKDETMTQFKYLDNTHFLYLYF